MRIYLPEKMIFTEAARGTDDLVNIPLLQNETKPVCKNYAAKEHANKTDIYRLIKKNLISTTKRD